MKEGSGNTVSHHAFTPPEEKEDEGTTSFIGLVPILVIAVFVFLFFLAMFILWIRLRSIKAGKDTIKERSL